MQTQEDNNKQLLDTKIIYFIGFTHATLHFIVGVIWQNVALPKGDSALLSLPYFGGYLTLVAVAFLLIFIYLTLSLRKEPIVPLHIRRFSLTLSIIITVGSIILFLVMCIRTNDYRREKDDIAKQAYYGAVLMTVVDILATIFCMPTYIYLNLCNYKSVKTTEVLEKKEASLEPNAPCSDRNLMSDEQPTEQRQTVNLQQNQVTAPTPNIQPQFSQQPQTTNSLHISPVLPFKPQPKPEQLFQTASVSN